MEILFTFVVGLMVLALGAFALVQRQIDVVRITQARACVRLPDEDSEFGR